MMTNALGMVGSVSREASTFAMVGADGRIDLATARRFAAADHRSTAAALRSYEASLPHGGTPVPSVIAVAGIARGETITITNSPRTVSRHDFAAVLGRAPTIINDAAAIAWGLTGGRDVRLEPVSAGEGFGWTTGGSYCLVSLDLELGVSTFALTEHGPHVMPSEAGATLPPYVGSGPADIIERLRAADGRLESYNILSASGLIRLAELAGFASARGVRADAAAVRRVIAANDRAAISALDTYSAIFWGFVTNLVLSHGAWDGLILTGQLAAMLRARFAAEAPGAFAISGPHTRALRNVPIVFATFDAEILSGSALLLRSLQRPHSH